MDENKVEVSIGNELKDAYKETDKWVQNGIQWMSDIQSFYKERAAIEKEYSTKLQALCSEYFKRKAKISTALSVGDTPKITPGSLESASLVTWTEVLTQTEIMAKERSRFAGEISLQIADQIAGVAARHETLRSRYAEFNERLIKERDQHYEELKKSKAAYDAACQSMENQRSKQSKSFDLKKDRAARKLQEKEWAMNDAKNLYIIKINIANRLKDKYYYQDIPEVLDGLQELNETRVQRLKEFWNAAGDLEAAMYGRCCSSIDAYKAVVSQNHPTLDTAMFVKHNLSEWKEPEDFYYVPSPVWHDDEHMITGEEELKVLRKRLDQAARAYTQYEEITETEKEQLRELAEKKKAVLTEGSPGYLEVLSKYLSALKTFAFDDTKRVAAEVEVETIEAAAGDKDLSLAAGVAEKKHKRLFFLGKSSKYEHGSKHSKSKDAGTAATDDAVSVFSGKSGRSAKSGKSGGLGRFTSVLSRNKPRANTTSSVLSISTARALYAYAAQGSDELDVQPGDEMTVVEPDDGSGWTKVCKTTGQEGLVPTSYIQISDGPAESILSTSTSESTGGPSGGGGRRVGPQVAPKRGARKVKYVQALYPYAAQGSDELSIAAGDKILVTKEDSGDGWTEGELNGVTGLFPTSYVRSL